MSSSYPYLWDPIRRKKLRATPEERVRQLVISYLTTHLQYPTGLISIEKEICLGIRRRRYDIIVFDTHAYPFLLVECKAPSISITHNDPLIAQVLSYHLVMPAPFLLLTNGDLWLCFKKVAGRFVAIPTLPPWNKVSTFTT